MVTHLKNFSLKKFSCRTASIKSVKFFTLWVLTLHPPRSVKFHNLIFFSFCHDEEQHCKILFLDIYYKDIILYNLIALLLGQDT